MRHSSAKLLALALLGASCASGAGDGRPDDGAMSSSGSGGAHAGSSGSSPVAGGATSGSSGSGGSTAGQGGSGTASAGSGTVANAGTPATAGSTAGGGAGTAMGGSTSGGTSAVSGAAGSGGTSGAGTSGAGTGGGGTGGGGAGPFVCNQLTGGKLTEEWFIAGFEMVVDDARWQVKWREDAYVEVWADAQSSFWTAQVDSKCTNGSSAPDRLVFGTVSFKYKTQAEWRTGITQAVNNFKAKWPSIRRVDLVTQIRGPKNMLCPTAPIAGETISVPPEQDAAMADVAAAFPGFVFVGPKVEAQSCSDFQGGGPHLTAAGNKANVSVLADYFVQVQ